MASSGDEFGREAMRFTGVEVDEKGNPPFRCTPGLGRWAGLLLRILRRDAVRDGGCEPSTTERRGSHGVTSWAAGLLGARTLHFLISVAIHIAGVYLKLSAMVSPLLKCDGTIALVILLIHFLA